MGNRDSRLRLGIIGCGEVGLEKHLRALRSVECIEVVALADREKGRAAAAAAIHRIPGHYASTGELLDHPGLEAVAVCVPPADHAAVAVAALQAGKNVLIEKPLALSSADGALIATAAASSPGRALMGFHMRWHRLIRRARQIVRDGRLGTVESIRTIWFSPRPDEDLPAWRHTRQQGGGAIIEIGVHCYDLWRYLLGAEVLEVSATTRSGTRHDESSVVTARLTDGILATALLSERTVHEIEVEICGDGGRLRVGCQRFDGLEFLPSGATPGDARTRFRAFQRFLRELPGGLRNLNNGGDYLDSYRQQWRHFHRVVRLGETPECTLQDGQRVIEVSSAAIRSAETGQPATTSFVNA